jgi:hypothetical protein
MVWFCLLFIWIWLLIVVFGDIFRSRDLSGWGKVLWIIFVIARRQDSAMRAYVQEAAGTAPSAAEESTKIAALRDQGVIDEADSQRAKAPDSRVTA